MFTNLYLDTPEVKKRLGVGVADQQVSEELAAGTQDGLVNIYLLAICSS